MAKDIVIFGNTDIARLAYHYFSTDTDRTVAAFCVDDEWCKSPQFRGLPLVPFSRIGEYPPDSFDMFVAMGYGGLNAHRKEVFERLEGLGYGFASYVSSRATVLNGGRIGRNAFIMEDNTVQPFSEVGDDVVMWSGNHIGHDSRIGAHCFLTSHVVVSGYVEIGERCFIGVNSTMRDGVKVGARSIVGAGSLILSDLPDGSVCIERGTKPLPMDSSEFLDSGFSI